MFNLFDPQTRRSAKAVALVVEGKLLFSERVTTTEVPFRIAPWVEQVSGRGQS